MAIKLIIDDNKEKAKVTLKSNTITLDTHHTNGMSMIISKDIQQIALRAGIAEEINGIITLKMAILNELLSRAEGAIGKIEFDVDDFNIRLSRVQQTNENIKSEVLALASNDESLQYDVSEIDQKADSIALRVTEVEGDIVEDRERITKAESDILLLPDQIKLEVSKIQIGAVNKLQNSDFSYTDNEGAYSLVPWETENMNAVIEADEDYDHAIKLSRNADNNRLYQYTKWEMGERYAISFMAKADAPMEITATRSNADIANFSLTTEWKRYVGFIDSTATETDGEGFFSFKASSNTQFYLTQIMLERGTIASDWARADTDMASQLMSEIKLTSDAITSSVSKSFEAVDNSIGALNDAMDGKYDDLTQQIGSVSSEIKQTADNVTIKFNEAKSLSDKNSDRLATFEKNIVLGTNGVTIKSNDSKTEANFDNKGMTISTNGKAVAWAKGTEGFAMTKAILSPNADATSGWKITPDGDHLIFSKENF